MNAKEIEEKAKRLFRGDKSDKPTDEQTAEDRSFDTSAPTRPITPLSQGEKHDHLAKHEANAEDRQEALLDEAIEETFPGSDPISPKHIT